MSHPEGSAQDANILAEARTLPETLNGEAARSGEAKFAAKLFRIVGRTMEDAAVNFEGRDAAFAAVGGNNVFGGASDFFNVNFLENQSVLSKKMLGAPAIGAPASRIHANASVHPYILPFLRGSQGNTLYSQMDGNLASSHQMLDSEPTVLTSRSSAVFGLKNASPCNSVPRRSR